MKFKTEDLVMLYKKLVRARAYDELFVRRISEGRLMGFYHSARGEEAVMIGAASFLKKEDYMWASHRGHGIPHMIAKGTDPKTMLAEHTGKATGQCGGFSTFHCKDTENGILGAVGTMGSGFSIALGMGLAAKKNGRGQVAMCFFGDGMAARGTFHETFMIAAKWKLPIVYVCENNGMAQYVRFEATHPTAHVADLAKGYGMPSVTVDGQDVLAVAEAASKAIERARMGKGPSMVECMCYRFGVHAVGLPDMAGAEVRSKEEMAEMEKRDPVVLFREQLLTQKVLTGEDVERIDRAAAAEIEEAERFSDESPLVEPSAMAAALYA